MAERVGNDVNLMKLILGFYGESSYLYTGILSKRHKENLCLNSTTSKHHVGESRRRISREVWKDRGVQFITECLMSSASNGDLVGVQRIELYCRRNNIRLLTGRTRNPMDSAAASGDLRIIKWMFCKKFAMGKSTILAASKAPNAFENIGWLIDHKCEFDESAEIELAKRGDVNSLKILRNRKGLKGFSTNVLLNAVSCGPWAEPPWGERNVVEYLLEDGCELNADVLCATSSVGDLRTVRILWNYGCPCDPRVISFAALGSHLEVIKELRSYPNPCPWDSMTISIAVYNKDLDLMKFCIQERCPGFSCLLGNSGN